VPVCFPRADTTTGLSPEDILEKTDEEASLPLLFLLLVSCVEDRGEPRERHSPIEEAAQLDHHFSGAVATVGDTSTDILIGHRNSGG